MIKITHSLSDKTSDKIFNITLSENKVITESGKTAKLKLTEKEFENDREAFFYFEKKEWEMLKKGFLMKQPEASEGEPMLHYFMGSGYTGCLSLVNLGDLFAVYELKGDKNNYKYDALQFIDLNGNLKKSLDLPKVLPWNILFHDNKNFLLIDLDHFIYTYDIENDKFTQLTDNFKQPGSFISMSEHFIAFGAAPKIYVKDLESGQLLFEKEFDPQLYSGHSTQFKGAISKHGKLLATCTHAGSIEIFDIVSGKSETIQGNFEMVEKMDFIENDQILLVHEKYGSWGLRFFDLETKSELTFPDLKIPSYDTMIQHYTISKNGSQLIVVQHKNAYLFDLNEKKILYSFRLFHTIKNAKPLFGQDCVAFRTDYGCFSIYRI
jgi:WD40 repeat protein